MRPMLRANGVIGELALPDTSASLIGWVAEYVATWLTNVATAALFTSQALYLLFVSRINGGSERVRGTHLRAR
jgi:hypothetical protein